VSTNPIVNSMAAETADSVGNEVTKAKPVCSPQNAPINVPIKIVGLNRSSKKLAKETSVFQSGASFLLLSPARFPAGKVKVPREKTNVKSVTLTLACSDKCIRAGPCIALVKPC